jgi:hypothetical protein
MPKKGLVALIGLIGASVAFANNASLSDKKSSQNTVPASNNYSIKQSAPYIGAAFDVYNMSKSIFVGYGKILGQNQNLYLGGEVSAYVFSPDYNGAGVSILPVFFITNNTMTYLKFGVQQRSRPVYGLGFQTTIWKNTDLRAELVTMHANLGLVYKF